MLRYRIFLIGCLLLLAAMIYLDLSRGLHWTYYSGFVLLFLAGVVHGSTNIRSKFFIPVYYEGSGKENRIALTFDDGPDPVVTPQVLDLLKKYGMKATFFCIGEKVDEFPDIASRIVHEGHSIGNHTYFHGSFFDLRSSKKMKVELDRTNEALKRATGKTVRFFRPPYGVTNPPLAKASKGFDVIGWSLRSFDTLKGMSPGKIYDRVERRLMRGDIVLFHDTDPKITYLLERLLPVIEKKELEAVTVDELLNLQPYE